MQRWRRGHIPASRRRHSAGADIIKFLKSRKLSVTYKQYNVQQGKMMLPPLKYIKIIVF
jgi:hypothetical protein